MPRLSDLLAVPELGLTLVQAGSGNPDLTWASTTELRKLSPYLDGGEVVLTTGLDFSHNDPGWRDFVADLSRAHTAAIGFGVGVNHVAPPPALVRATSTYRVALFAVPPPTPFIAVSKAVAGLLRADELKSAQDAIRAQQHLLSGAHGAHNPAEVLASIAQATGRHLALFRPDGSAVAQTAGYSEVADLDVSQVEFIALDPDATLRLAVAGASTLSADGRAVIAAGAAALGLRARDQQIDEERERGRWGRVTRGLLTGVDWSTVVPILDPTLEVPIHIHAIVVQGASEQVANWRRLPRAGLERLVAVAPEPAAMTGLARAWQLCPAEPEALENAVSLIRWYGLDAVVGRAATLDAIPTSRNSAMSKLSSLSPTAPLYEAPRSPTIIHASVDTPLLESLLAHSAVNGASAGQPARAVLGVLSSGSTPDEASHDHAILRHTLRLYLQLDGQRGATAQALGIHRNTLRERLARIEQLTQRSLVRPDDRAELWLALRIEDHASG